MTVKMRPSLSASILLMLSLQAAALLVAGHSFDAAVDVVGTIRLPSDDAQTAARPWKCCDRTACFETFPLTCRCLDEVERCAATCKRCEPSTSHPSLFVCKDEYVGEPGPICRPWKCCNEAGCTKSIPPICRCADEVDQCAPTCKSCVASTSDPSRHVCKDTYRGFPGPKCTPRCCFSDLLD